MSEARTGGCQCGAVRYELVGEPLALVICHCRECQKQTSSAFGMSLPVAKENLRVSGALREWRRRAERPRGRLLFLPDLRLAPLSQLPARPGYWHLKPGTLNDTSWLDPVAEVWTRSAQPWLDFSGRLLSFAHEPDDAAAIEARWQSRKARARNAHG